MGDMSPLIASMAVLFGIAGSTVPTPPAAPPSLSDRLRHAIAISDTKTILALTHEDPWGVREVANQLADLAMHESAEAPEGALDEQALRPLVLAGHLAAVYRDETGDETLADRVRRMARWSPEEKVERAGVDDALAAVETAEPPSAAVLEAGLEICRRLGDGRGLGLVHGGLGRLLERQGRLPEAADSFAAAAETLRAAGELRWLRDAQLSRGQILLRLQRAEAAAEVLDSAASLGAQLQDPAGRVGALFLLAEALRANGKEAGALAALTEARRTAINADLPGLAARAIMQRTMIRDGAAVGAGAAPDALAAARLAEEAGDLDLTALAWRWAARLYLEAPDLERAGEAAGKALAAARLGKSGSGEREALLLAADVDARSGLTERALRRLHECADAARAAGDRERLLDALERFGLLQFGDGDGAASHSVLVEGRALAIELDRDASRARIEEALAELARRAGDPAGARALLESASGAYARAGDGIGATRVRNRLRSISGAAD